MHIEIKNLELRYEIYHDKTDNLKEAVINFFSKKKYVQKKMDSFYALSNLNLTIKQGERVGIIGANGAGKSTLLKVVSGILKPTAGEISVTGSIQPLIEVGAGFDPEFSGRENIYFNGYLLGFTKKQIATKLNEIIEFADLKEFIEVPVKYYSTGMAVRLAFTIATCIEPEILIIDEMLGAGDAHFVEKAMTRMSALIDKSKIMLMVSHDLNMIEKMCNRVIFLKNGQVVYDGNPADSIGRYLEKK